MINWEKKKENLSLSVAGLTASRVNRRYIPNRRSPSLAPAAVAILICRRSLPYFLASSRKRVFCFWMQYGAAFSAKKDSSYCSSTGVCSPSTARARAVAGGGESIPRNGISGSLFRLALYLLVEHRTLRAPPVK